MSLRGASATRQSQGAQIASASSPLVGEGAHSQLYLDADSSIQARTMRQAFLTDTVSILAAGILVEGANEFEGADQRPIPAGGVGLAPLSHQLFRWRG